ncbi:TIGR03643 family protein [Acinetobacter sp. ANC 3903]|nr:TIGR03643 family protein [Acinetobacter sp. ANC 3903]
MLSLKFYLKNENNQGPVVRRVIEYVGADLSRIIEMAWEDRTPFEAIQREFGLNEAAVIRLMRQNMKPSSFKMWRERVTGRKTKHLQLRSPDVIRAYCSRQYKRF